MSFKQARKIAHAKALFCRKGYINYTRGRYYVSASLMTIKGC